MKKWIVWMIACCLVFASAVSAGSAAAEPKAGDIIRFGHYEQDNNTENGPEEIEWIVLDTQDGKCFVVSKYLLDAHRYYRVFTAIDWAHSDIRSWLNDEFLKTAFTEEEQASIPVTLVDNSKSQGVASYKTDGCENTEDKIFLLSYKEFAQYLEGTPDQIGTPTAYAKTRSAWLNEEGNGMWWLRSPGYNDAMAMYVSAYGSYDYYDVDNGLWFVRPALWLIPADGE